MHNMSTKSFNKNVYFQKLYPIQLSSIYFTMSRDGTNRPDGHRRKWDKGEYEKKAKARSREERGLDAEEEDNRYSKKSSNRKDPLNHHKDRNARDKDAEEEDEDWDALDEDWDGYRGILGNYPLTRVSRFK